MTIERKVDYWRELRNPRVLGTVIGFILAVLGLTNADGNALVDSILGFLGLVVIFASIAPRAFLVEASKTIRRLQPHQRGKRIIAVVLIGLVAFSGGIFAGYALNSYISAQDRALEIPTTLVAGTAGSSNNLCYCNYPDYVSFASSTYSVRAVALYHPGTTGDYRDYSVFLPSNTAYYVHIGFQNRTSGLITECVPKPYADINAPSYIYVSHFTRSSPVEYFSFSC